LKKEQDKAGAARWMFLVATNATFATWGAFCAWTLKIYAGQWTAMLLLLSTASLAGGATSSLAPNLPLAWNCLIILVGPTIVSALALGDSRHWAWADSARCTSFIC